jgi:hypothetical protein
MQSKGFMAGTIVLVPDGWIAIENLRVGDQVLARDAASGDTAIRAVTSTLDLPAQEVMLVRFHQEGRGFDSMRIDTLATTAAQSFHAKSDSSHVNAGSSVGNSSIASAGSYRAKLASQ